MVRTINIGGIDYLHSYSLGYAVKSRVGESVNKGLLKRDDKMKDYGLTTKTTVYENFWRWLQGDNDSLVLRKSILD